MTAERYQVTIKTEDNVLANFVTNTWYFDIADTTGRLNAANALYAFYNGVDIYYSNVIQQNGHILKVYDMTEPEPRAPILETTFNFDTNPA